TPPARVVASSPSARMVRRPKFIEGLLVVGCLVGEPVIGLPRSIGDRRKADVVTDQEPGKKDSVWAFAAFMGSGGPRSFIASVRCADQMMATASTSTRSSGSHSEATPTSVFAVSGYESP